MNKLTQTKREQANKQTNKPKVPDSGTKEFQS
jgi:hypothetical protein